MQNEQSIKEPDPAIFNAKRIGWELAQTAQGEGYYGGALRAAKDFHCVNESERTILDQWASGLNASPKDTLCLQEIATKVYFSESELTEASAAESMLQLTAAWFDRPTAAPGKIQDAGEAVQCDSCNGMGLIDGVGNKCPHCKGEGQMESLVLRAVIADALLNQPANSPSVAITQPAAQFPRPHDLSRLEPFVHGLGKAILRELMMDAQSAQLSLRHLTHDEWDAWKDKWGVILERSALDELRAQMTTHGSVPKQEDWRSDIQKVIDSLDPDDWCGDEAMITALNRALASAPLDEQPAPVPLTPEGCQILSAGDWVSFPLERAREAVAEGRQIRYLVAAPATQSSPLPKGWPSDGLVSAAAKQSGFDLSPMPNMLYTVRGNHAQLVNFARAMLATQPAAPVTALVTEEMHIAAVKVLHRANGVDGLPQRMLDAMLAVQPAHPAPVQDVDWKDMYEKEKRRSEMWVAKYERDIGPLEYAMPVAETVQDEAWMAQQTTNAAHAIQCATDAIAAQDKPMDEVRRHYGPRACMNALAEPPALEKGST